MVFASLYWLPAIFCERCVWADAITAPFQRILGALLWPKGTYCLFVFAVSVKFHYFFCAVVFRKRYLILLLKKMVEEVEGMIFSPDDRSWLYCALFIYVSHSSENPSQNSDPYSFFFFHFVYLFIYFFKYQSIMWISGSNNWIFFILIVFELLKANGWNWWLFPQMIDADYTERNISLF